MNPLIGRTCEFGRTLLRETTVLKGLIMDVAPSYLAEAAGSVARTRHAGWVLLCLVAETGELIAVEHGLVRLT